ncbi:hypothetical protein Syun_016613 [Stephania yunnanensis]|uniref:Uncharacterized protein n=1 Tax=Stephania yunnanensis TaxID=152371 RepID=A0AAP0J7T4_9MAGN
MSRVRAPGLILQTENIDLPPKGATAKNITTSISKTVKGGKALGNRKPLQDISNSSAITNNTSKRKKNQEKNEKSFLQEGFLHDHKKCVEAQRAGMNKRLFDVFLSEHGLLSPGPSSPKSKEPEVYIASSPRFLELELVAELPTMDDVVFRCSSPIFCDSPPSSPSQYELPELVLRP